MVVYNRSLAVVCQREVCLRLFDLGFTGMMGPEPQSVNFSVCSAKQLAVPRVTCMCVRIPRCDSRSAFNALHLGFQCEAL